MARTQAGQAHQISLQLGQSNSLIADIKSRLNRNIRLSDLSPELAPAFAAGADFAGSTNAGSVFIPMSSPLIQKSARMAVAFNASGRDVFTFNFPAVNGNSDTGLNGYVTIETDSRVVELDGQAQTTLSTTPIVNGRRVSDVAYSATVAS
ncbi:MAG: hypothetical protein CTY21_14120, partial [Methylomonas sp.]